MEDQIDEKSQDIMLTIRERFERAVNLNFVRNAEGNEISCKLPGFKYDDFDRSGFPDLMKINRIFENTRYCQFSYFGVPDTSNHAFVILSANLHVSRRLFSDAALVLPMTLRVVVTQVGRSSMDVHQSLELDDSSRGKKDESGNVVIPNNILAVRTVRFVRINLAGVRRSAPFDDDIRRRYQRIFSDPSLRPAPSGDWELLRNIPVVPERAYRCTIKVRRSETDLFDHTTQSFYVSYAVETAACATKAGAYRAFHDDISKYQARKARFLHVGEALYGDELIIVSWDDVEYSTRLYFVMYCRDIVICCVEISYYESDLMSRL